MNSYQKPIKILAEVTPFLDSKWIELNNITIYEGYIDFNFNHINDSAEFYEYLQHETYVSSDRDESRNAYLVRIFY